MSSKVNPPFRAEHLGSLKRPQYLLEKRNDLDDKKCTQEELTVVEDKAIAEIVQMQREAGIKTITDGEFRMCVVRSIPSDSKLMGVQAHVLRRCLRQHARNDLYPRWCVLALWSLNASGQQCAVLQFLCTCSWTTSPTSPPSRSFPSRTQLPTSARARCRARARFTSRSSPLSRP